MKKKNQGPVPITARSGPTTRIGNKPLGNRLATANSPAKLTSDKFLIASSIFENGDDNLTRLEEEFLDAARTGDYGRLEKLLQQRSEYSIDVNVRDEETGNTAIMFAAKRGHVKLVELLVRHCADVTLRNYEGQTAVEMASPAIQQLLLQSVDKGGPHRNLLQAAWQGNVLVIQKILRDCQVDIECTNGDGLTPLLLVTRDLQLFEKMKEKISTKYSPVEVISLLLEHRADPWATDSEGKTAVHYAASSKSNIAKELIQVLLGHSQCTDVQDRRCFMPIHCAAQSGSVDMVIALLDSGSAPNARGFAGATPLHISALNGHEPVCGVLLDRGADVTVVDDSGLSPVDVAKSKKVKATLKQAWVEATEKKGNNNQLNPVRPPSRSDQPAVKSILRRSKSFNIGNKHRRTGEVIFDSLHTSGSFDNIPKKSSLLSNADKARLAEEHMLRESLEHNVSPSPFSSTFRGNTKTNLLTTPRCPSRSPSRSPPTSRKLAPLKGSSPRKPTANNSNNSKREIKFGPGTKAYDGKGTGLKQPGGSKVSSSYSGLKKCPSDPTKFSGGGPSITVVGLDGDEHHQQCWRSQGSFPNRKGHVRQGSDPFTSSTPTFDGAKTPDDFFLRGHSPSHISVISMSEDWETSTNNTSNNQYYSTTPPNRLSPLSKPQASSNPQRLGTGAAGGPGLTNSFEELVVVSPRGGGGGCFGGQFKQSDGRNPHQLGQKPQVLTLERMQITNRQFSPAMDVNIYNYPTSKKLLPPTPVYQETLDTDRSTKNSGSKESSPRTDEDEVEEDGEVTRAKSVLRQGDFRLEDTQVGSSNDSGLPEDKSSSKSSSVASSTSTFSNGSPRTQESNASPGKKECIPHSNSTPALSAMDKPSKDRATSLRTSMDSSIISSSTAKHKRNTSFSNVRENTGFMKPDGKCPLSSNKRGPGHQSGVRKPSDNTKSDLSDNRPVRGESGKNSVQSAKLRIIAKDNANNQPGSSFQNKLETNKEEDTLVKTSENKVHKHTKVVNSSNNKTVSVDSGDKKLLTSHNQSSNRKTHVTTLSQVNTPAGNLSNVENSSQRNAKDISNQVSKTSRSVSAMNSNKTNTQQQQPQVLQLKASSSNEAKKSSATDVGKANTNVKSSPISDRNKSSSASANNVAAKVIHVQEARGNSGIGAGSSNSTKDNQLGGSNPSNVGQNNLTKSSSSTKPDSRQPSVSSSNNQSSAHPNVGGKPKIEPSVSKKGPVSTAGNKSNTRQGSVSTSSNSGVNRQSSVNSSFNYAVQRQTSVNNNNTSSITKPSSNTSQYRQQTDTNNSRNPKQLTSTSSNNNPPVSKPVSVAKTSLSQSSANSKIQMSNSTNGAKSAPKSNNVTNDSVQQPGRQQANSSDNNDSSKQKPTHTTTMTFSLSNPGSANVNPVTDSKVNNSSSGGDAPVPPPRKKRSSASSRSSSDSVENIADGSNGSNVVPNSSRNTVVTDYSVHTLKHGMTPMTAKNVSTLQSVNDENDEKKVSPARPPLPVTKQRSLDSNTSNQTNQKDNTRRYSSELATSVEHEGPVIWDPFESLNARRQKEFAEMLAKERENSEKKQPPPRSGKGRGNVNTKKNENKSKPERQSSAGKNKRTRSKQPTVGDDGNKKRPISSKRRRKRKKKEEEDKRLSQNADNTNVALIGGIGWHIETDCDDKTDVQAVTLMDDSDLSEEEFNITVVPDYLRGKQSDNYTKNVRTGGKLQRELTIQVSGTIPGQISEESGGEEEEDSDEYTDDDSDFEDIPENAEIVHDNVQYIFGEGLSERSERPLQHRDKADSENVVHPQTEKALKQFDKKISDNDLDYMLGKKFPNIFNNTSPRLTNVTSQTHLDRNKNETKKGSNLHRNNSLPSSQKRPTPRSIRKRHPSVGDTEKVDPEIDEMIDEILKSTPNPSLTLSIGSAAASKNEKKLPTKSMTREEFADALSQGGGASFREVINSSNQRDRSNKLGKSNLDDDQIAKLVRNRSQAELQELIEWKNKVDDLNEQEQRQLNKLMNTVKNLGLKVPSSAVAAERNNNNNHNPKDLMDIPEKAIGGINNKNDDSTLTKKPPSGASMKPSEMHMMEKSPRFVRKKESTTNKPLNAEQIKDANTAGFPADSISSFGSISIPSDSLRREDSFVDDRTEVVTSRLGRSAPSSRAGATSVMSEEDTIQWKRGNILGKGAYGIVWCGLVNSGELIAVKQIELNIEDRERAEAEYEKIQQEVDLLKTLKHPNIVGYLGTSLEETTVSIFMQFVPGGSIANLLARFGPLEEEVFYNYTKQILEGVQYLHANDVIHRDIKGGNIMVMHNGVIKLIDFGCAKRLCLNVSTKVTAQSKSRLLKSMRGTPYWMAPEVVKETGHGTKSDIWSIGCTMHEMSTGKPPWTEMPQMTAIFNIGNDSVPVPELPEKFSTDSRDFARVCMTRNPNKRPSATDLLKHPFILRRKKSRSNSVANVSDYR